MITGTGSDHVTYELDGNLQTPDQELVFVGSGVKKGGGTLQFTVNIVGRINDGSNLVVLGVPDPKKPTTMTVNDSGEIDGSLTTGISTLGNSKFKPGPENFNLQSTGKIGPNGTLDLAQLEAPAMTSRRFRTLVPTTAPSMCSKSVMAAKTT